jgi:hypothetical protein
MAMEELSDSFYTGTYLSLYGEQLTGSRYDNFPDITAILHGMLCISQIEMEIELGCKYYFPDWNDAVYSSSSVTIVYEFEANP